MGFCAVPVDSQISKGHILKDIVRPAKPNRRARRWVPARSCLFLELSPLPLRAPPHRMKLRATPESTCFLHLSPATGTPSSLAHRQISSFCLVSLRCISEETFYPCSPSKRQDRPQSPGCTQHAADRLTGETLRQTSTRGRLVYGLRRHLGAGTWWINCMKNSASCLNFKVICCLFNGN